MWYESAGKTFNHFDSNIHIVLIFIFFYFQIEMYMLTNIQPTISHSQFCAEYCVQEQRVENQVCTAVKLNIQPTCCPCNPAVVNPQAVIDQHNQNPIVNPPALIQGCNCCWLLILFTSSLCPLVHFERRSWYTSFNNFSFVNNHLCQSLAIIIDFQPFDNPVSGSFSVIRVILELQLCMHHWRRSEILEWLMVIFNIFFQGIGFNFSANNEMLCLNKLASFWKAKTYTVSNWIHKFEIVALHVVIPVFVPFSW